jgi:hypothetical protein
MKLFAKLFAVGFATISLTSSTIAVAQQDAPISGGSPTSAPKETKLQNVREYFMALPDEFIPNLTKKVRAQSIVPDGEGSNINEGYLEFKIPDDTLPPKYREILLNKKGEARLFKHRDGSTILGMLVTFCQKPGNCESQPRFMQYKAGVWRNVTNTILPKISDQEAAKLASTSVSAPKLPTGQKITTYYGLASADKLHILHGTCLDKTCTSTSILQAYTWNGSKFVVYQYPEGP